MIELTRSSPGVKDVYSKNRRLDKSQIRNRRFDVPLGFITIRNTISFLI